MKRSTGETLLCLLQSFGGVSYAFAFQLLSIWIRFLFIAMERAVEQRRLARQQRGYRFVHTLSHASTARSNTARLSENDRSSIGRPSALRKDSAVSLLTAGFG